MNKLNISRINFIVLISLMSSCKNEALVTIPDPNFHIYLCFGQSNMEGVGVIETQDSLDDSRFLVYQSMDCPEQGFVHDEWRTATPPICNCNSGHSPADYFGRSMIAAQPKEIKVGLVSVAIGGCDIRLFDKDIYQDYDSTYAESWFADKVAYYNGNPYEFLIKQAKKVQKDGVIKGILLHQGETNTGDTLWPSYVQKIYDELLEDLSLEATNVPLLAGEVVRGDSSCCTHMNPIINTLPEYIETAHIISSEGLGAMDRAHFDSEGYRELGKRYAKKMLELQAD